MVQDEIDQAAIVKKQALSMLSTYNDLPSGIKARLLQDVVSHILQVPTNRKEYVHLFNAEV